MSRTLKLEPKRRPGRPSLKEGEQSIHYGCRLTKSQWEQLTRAAKDSDKHPSEVIRDALDMFFEVKYWQQW